MIHPMYRSTIIFLGILSLAATSLGGIRFLSEHAASRAMVSQDAYVRFEMEAFDSIKENYWQKADDAQLANLFQLSLEKAGGSVATSAVDRLSTEAMLQGAFDAVPDAAAKKQLALDILQVALYNLPPVGRNQLYSAQAVKELRDTVSNVNPQSDLYGELGVTAAASAKDINAAYERAEQTATSTAARERAAYVRDVLTDEKAKERYDTTKAEPTVFSKMIGTTLYVRLDKVSPSVLDEFLGVLDKASTTPATSMIIDLRGNIGGALDLAPHMIGLFFGPNQYSFDLFRKGEYLPQRSAVPKIPALTKYRDIAVLVDGQTQSTAEVFTAAVKRFRLATVIGTTTKGWGSVENTYPLTTSIDPDTQYALFLVNSLTLRDDGEPIEGKGVDPDISVGSKAWQNALPNFVRSAALRAAVQEVIQQQPGR